MSWCIEMIRARTSGLVIASAMVSYSLLMTSLGVPAGATVLASQSHRSRENPQRLQVEKALLKDA